MNQYSSASSHSIPLSSLFNGEIRVGIHTAGHPRLTPLPDGSTLLENLLIGKDFHWQQEMSAILPGRVEITPNGLINILPLETYLECVVGSEMNPAAPKEFLKAHAIISRSWALGKVLSCHPQDDTGKIDTPEVVVGWDDTAEHVGFDVCSDDHCQRYQGVQPISPVALDAIRSTAGVVLADKEGKIVDARFSKCCGGKSEVFSSCWQDREMPCLESVDDPWCDLSGLSSSDRGHVLRSVLKDYDLSTDGGFRWQQFVSREEIARNLEEKFRRSVGTILHISPERRGVSGRITLLRIEGDKGSVTLGKELWIRRLLSPTHLYSSAFNIEETSDGFLLDGRGWGHGVGLCQIGAARMALAGASAPDILSFYYPHSRLLTM